MQNAPGRIVLTLMAGAFVALSPGGIGRSEAMEQPPQVLRVACAVEGKGTTLPDGICADFAARLQQAHPNRDVVLGQPADVVLVVSRSDTRAFAARIDRDGVAGETLATARRGAALDAPARQTLLDSLIAQTPL